jgi:hypothetical protein
MSESSQTKYTFPFLPILTLIFITLKLTGYIDWSWFWVLSPMLIPAGLIILAFAIFFAVYPFLNKNKK